MQIRLTIEGTEAVAKEGTYVFLAPIGGQPAHQLLEQIESYVLRSLVELRKLDVRE